MLDAPGAVWLHSEVPSTKGSALLLRRAAQLDSNLKLGLQDYGEETEGYSVLQDYLKKVRASDERAPSLSPDLCMPATQAWSSLKCLSAKFRHAVPKSLLYICFGCSNDEA